MSKDFCNCDCNHCEAVHNRQLTVILNALYEIYGDGVYEVVEHLCPNMTCCADCQVDDFTHLEGCELEKAAHEIAEKQKTANMLNAIDPAVVEQIERNGGINNMMMRGKVK